MKVSGGQRKPTKITLISLRSLMPMNYYMGGDYQHSIIHLYNTGYDSTSTPVLMLHPGVDNTVDDMVLHLLFMPPLVGVEPGLFQLSVA